MIFSDTENGISKVIRDDSEEPIVCNGKNQVGIDYLIEQNGQYTFKAMNGRNQEISKTLVVNDDFRNNLIEISENSEEELSYIINVSIDYKNINHGKHMYKIGNDTSWSEYTEPFFLTSYEVFDNELYDDTTNNKTLTIYAKVEDDANRKVEISKKVVRLDLDFMQKPEITMHGSNYPTLFEEGMVLGSDVTITYVNRTDCKNYYSLDNENWKEYTGPVSIPSHLVYAKSVKTTSGLEVVAQATTNDSQIAGDALPYQAYDGNEATSCGFYGYRFIVDSSAWEKNIRVKTMGSSYDRYKDMNFYAYNSEGTNIGTMKVGYCGFNGSDYVYNINIPANTKYISMDYRGHSALYEITVIN